MHDLKGKNAILTGASSGIGIPIAREFAREGINMAITARPDSINKLQTVACELSELGVRVIPITADLSQSTGRQFLVEQAQAELGSVDLLVNNAGIEYTAAFSRIGEEKTRDIIETNLLAPLELARLTLPGMLARNCGHIVNMSSMAGKSPLVYNSVYSATKAGLISWSKTVRDELEGTGVSMSVICPGFISEVGWHARTGLQTPWIAREVAPERVAKAVVDAVQRDLLEVLVWAMPVRPLLAMIELVPSLARFVYGRFGLTDFLLRRATEAEKDRE